jgi:hypothetical protein
MNLDAALQSLDILLSRRCFGLQPFRLRFMLLQSSLGAPFVILKQFNLHLVKFDHQLLTLDRMGPHPIAMPLGAPLSVVSMCPMDCHTGCD